MAPLLAHSTQGYLKNFIPLLLAFILPFSLILSKYWMMALKEFP